MPFGTSPDALPQAQQAQHSSVKPTDQDDLGFAVLRRKRAVKQLPNSALPKVWWLIARCTRSLFQSADLFTFQCGTHGHTSSATVIMPWGPEVKWLPYVSYVQIRNQFIRGRPPHTTLHLTPPCAGCGGGSSQCGQELPVQSHCGRLPGSGV